MAIFNKCKNILDDFINNLETESSDWPRPIHKGLRNMPKSEGSSTKLLERNYLNKDILNRSSQLAPRTWDF